MFTLKKLTVILSAAILLLGATGCGQSSASAAESEESAVSQQGDGDVIRIKVAYAQAGKPITYTDENGDPAGYEVAMFQLIDELLPQYEFEYIGTADDDLLIGVESGKYQVGLKNTFYTEERSEKYIYPKTYMGASKTGLIVRAEDQDKVYDFESLASFSGKLSPLSPLQAQYSMVLEYNAQHPDNAIELEEYGQWGVTEWPIWLTEGRYDAVLDISSTFENLIEAEEGSYHNLQGQLVFNTFTGTKTWPLFNKNEQELADAYDEAVAQLIADGTRNRLMIEYLGEDVTELIND